MNVNKLGLRFQVLRELQGGDLGVKMDKWRIEASQYLCFLEVSVFCSTLYYIGPTRAVVIACNALLQSLHFRLAVTA